MSTKTKTGQRGQKKIRNNRIKKAGNIFMRRQSEKISKSVAQLLGAKSFEEEAEALGKIKAMRSVMDDLEQLADRPFKKFVLITIKEAR